MFRWLLVLVVLFLTVPASAAPFARRQSPRAAASVRSVKQAPVRRGSPLAGRTRLRDRLDDLESQADHTMTDARQLLDALQRGVDVELVKTGPGGLWNFLTGPPGTVFPFSVRVQPMD